MDKKVKLALIVSFSVFILSLLASLVYLSMQNNALDQTSASVGANGVCTTTSDCDTNLICVDWGGTTKMCSALKLHSTCDKTSKLCGEGLTCVNNKTSGEGYVCTDKKENSSCSVDSDCLDGMKCVASQYYNGKASKFCSKMLNNSYCDKTSKLCGDGLTCVNITNQGFYEQWVCTNKKSGSYCTNDSNCDSGLKCVEHESKYFKCTNFEENSPCDINTKTCGSGLECKITNGVGKCMKKASGTTDTAVDCGNIDSNNDKKIDIIDFAKFASIYGKACKV